MVYGLTSYGVHQYGTNAPYGIVAVSGERATAQSSTTVADLVKISATVNGVLAKAKSAASTSTTTDVVASINGQTATAKSSSQIGDLYIFGIPGEVTMYVDGNRIDTYQDLSAEKRLNEVGTFNMTAFITEDSQRGLLSEGQDMKVLEDNTLIYKGRIEDVNYDTAFQAEVEGEDMSNRLLDRKTGREKFENVAANQVALDIANRTPLSIGKFDSAPLTSLRFDHDNLARALAGTANSVGFDWYIDQKQDDGYDTDYINFVERQGSATTVKKFTIGESARFIDDGNEQSFVANDITLLGRGDGVNQLEVRVWAAADTFTQLDGQIPDTHSAGDTFNVDDTTKLGGTGDEVRIKVGAEMMNVDITDSTTLTINSRGLNDYGGDETPVMKHRDNISVWTEENITQGHGPWTPEERDTAENGSSIADIGVKQLRDTDKTIVDLPTLEQVADRQLRNRRRQVKTIEISPTDPRDTKEVELGDDIQIEGGLGSDLSGEYRVVGIDINRRNAGESTVFHCANRPRRLVERLSEIERDRDTLNAHMQGSTTLDSQHFNDNCDNSHPLDNSVWVPEKAVAVNRFSLTFKRESFRGYVQNTDHSHSVTVDIPDHSHNASVDLPEHTHEYSIIEHAHSIGSLFTSSTIQDGDNANIWQIQDDQGNLYNAKIASPTSAPSGAVWQTGETLGGGQDTTQGGGGFTNVDVSVGGGSTQTSETTDNSGRPDYGIYEPAAEPTVDIDIVVDGTTVQTITDVGVGYESDVIQLKEYLDDPLAGSYHDVNIVPTGMCRLQADISGQYFVESTL